MRIRLAELEVLILDCQASGANPARGHLLECGWASLKAKTHNPSSFKPHTSLVQLPRGVTIPPRIRRITGMSESESIEALPARDVWESLLEAASRIGRNRPGKRCPTVIHYARFEAPFLEDLHHRFTPRIPFPFDLICTHALLKRVLPELPRRGLRAAAGYLGHTVPEQRRCIHHLYATAVIWCFLINCLRTEWQVRTWQDLLDWQRQMVRPPSAKRVYPMPKAERLNLPDCPGIYRMRRSNGAILYVGKAQSLKQRVSSYFQKRRHAEHLLEMLTQATQVDIICTESALEAALLESDSIKNLSPPYNRALRQEGRQLAFFTRDFRHAAPTPNRRYCIGPLPSPEALQAWPPIAARLGAVNGSKPLPEHGFTEALAKLWGPHGPQNASVEAGWRLFADKHHHFFKNRPPCRGLTLLGARLWQEKLAEPLNLETDEALRSSDSAAGRSSDWPPETICAFLESAVLRGSHLIRRARWLCMLSESTLVWVPQRTHHPIRRLLVIDTGRVIRRGPIPPDTDPPLPPGWRNSPLQRKQSLDLGAYDRLRVVTTELRRLVANGQQIWLRLSPSALLTTPAIVQALRWV